jgi:hypothetical protein
MKLADVAKRAFAMPLTDPAYPRGPYKFYNREFVVISYRSDPDILREVVPEPLEVAGDTVDYEFIRMPDSTGFGDYTETGQTTIRRSPAGARFGASRRSSPNRRSRMKARPWFAPCTMARCYVCRPPWATNITSLTRRLC